MNLRRLLGDRAYTLGSELSELRGGCPMVYLIREACLQYFNSEVSRLTPRSPQAPQPMPFRPVAQLNQPSEPPEEPNNPQDFLSDFQEDLGL